MNTLHIDSKAALTLARAIEKAKQEKPLVKKTTTYGVYEVRSSSNKSLWYKVTCNSATKEIKCNCPATKPCFHIAAVAPIHSWIARQRQEQVKAEADTANWPTPAASSEIPAFFSTEAGERAAQEWESVEINSETEAILDEVRVMLERDRVAVFGY